LRSSMHFCDGAAKVVVRVELPLGFGHGVVPYVTGTVVVGAPAAVVGVAAAEAAVVGVTAVVGVAAKVVVVLPDLPPVL
jgi:hypothetical protein